MTASDVDIVRSAVGGNVGAFERLADRYRSDVARTVLRYLGSGDEAEDATQEAFARALQNISRLRSPEAFGPWLRGIAANVCRETLKQRSRLVFCGTQHDPISPSWQKAVREWHADGGRGALRALAALPVEERALLVLHCLDGASLKDVSDLFEVSVGAVKMRVMRARATARGIAQEEQLRPRDVQGALADAYYYLAALHFRREKWDGLCCSWARALARRPQSSARIWETLKPSVYALSAAGWTAQAAPSGATTGASRLPGESLRAAMQALEWVLRRNPGEHSLWLTIGKVLLFGMRQLKDGVSAFDRAAENAGLRQPSLLMKAIGLVIYGSPDDTLACMEQMEREKMWDVDVPLVHAMAFAAVGAREAAVRDARRALAFAPVAPRDSYWTAHRYFAPGYILSRFGFEKEARRAYMLALDAAPPPPVSRRAIMTHLEA